MDEKLQKLIDEVFFFDETTPGRQKALNRLLIVVQQLPGIYKSNHQDYLEALNKTLEWVCRNLDKFKANPDKSLANSFVIWINGYLKWRIKDLYIPDRDYVDTTDRTISNAEGNQTRIIDLVSDPKFTPDPANPHTTLDLLDVKIAEIQKNKTQNLAERIIEFIEKDEKRDLRDCCPRANAECNCQMLAKRLLLVKPSHKISNIAREFNVSNQTLYSHWKKKCLPLLKEIGVNLRID